MTGSQTTETWVFTVPKSERSKINTVLVLMKAPTSGSWLAWPWYVVLRGQRHSETFNWAFILSGVTSWLGKFVKDTPFDRGVCWWTSFRLQNSVSRKVVQFVNVQNLETVPIKSGLKYFSSAKRNVRPNRCVYWEARAARLAPGIPGADRLQCTESEHKPGKSALRNRR